MPDPVKHHYVPVFFQKNFTNGAPKIWMHKKELGAEPIPITPEEIAFENDLNTIIKDGKKDISNEILLSNIEGIARPIIKKILDTKSLEELTPTERYDFAAFVILLSERNPRSFEIIDALAREEKAKELKDIATELSEDEMRKIFEDSAAKNPDSFAGVSFEEAKQFLLEGPNPKNIVFKDKQGLRYMWQSAKEGVPFLLRRDWNLLTPAEEGDEFILSDDPVLIIIADDDGMTLAKGAWQNKSIELVLPLSPKLCFYASNDISHIDAELDSDAMAEINVLSKGTAMRYFLSGSQNPKPIS
jgi:hypothetical protein